MGLLSPRFREIPSADRIYRALGLAEMKSRDPFTLLKRTPVKKRRGPRRGPRRDQAYKDWLKQNARCIIPVHDLFGLYTVDPAHTQNNGMSSRGPDSSCAPLCRQHHREYDAGRAAFEAKYGVDMEALAAKYYAEYLRQNGTKAGLPVPEKQSKMREDVIPFSNNPGNLG